MPRRQSLQSKTWQVTAAFAFGVVFVVAILTIALFRPNPTPFEYTIFRIVIALAAAGVGAILPGFLDISFRNWLRAGGALALFAIVYFMPPAVLNIAPTEEIVEPSADARPAADQWLAHVDQRQFRQAYDSMAAGFTASFPFEQFDELFVVHRQKLGAPSSRKLVSSAPYRSIPGAPKGAYRQYVYKATFIGEPKPLYESIWLFGEKDGWHVSGFSIAVQTEQGQFVAYEPN